MTTDALTIARDVRETLAPIALTPRQAKLYSQRVRREMGQEGLSSFSPGDVISYLEEAMLILECGWIERNDDINSPWRASVKRASEILEWLSQTHLKPRGAPLHLLAAAAYQLADFPAMALGHLKRMPADEPFSNVLRDFLLADFPGALRGIQQFWATASDLEPLKEDKALDLTSLSAKHVMMCLGTICAYLKTGESSSLERALTKLEALATGYLHSRDPYSYLLARLTSASARRFSETSLWSQIGRLSDDSRPAVTRALTQFARSAFQNRRILIWPAQFAGIEKLREQDSFALCTPTGSGKTTIATLAAVQGLYYEPPTSGFGTDVLAPNIVLYLVPSRALAAEVEGRLAEDLTGIAAERVVVTGLYGGVDWGPTDAWINTSSSAVVICTFEKADALLRYLGVLFLDRVRTVIIDEAHMVEQDLERLEELREGNSRAFRLEQLGARIIRAREEYGFRVIALSAVAASAAPSIARWTAGSAESVPVSSTYRSTRQMVGRLEVRPDGQYSIRYNLKDGCSLKFDDAQRGDTPFVPNPFPPLPGGIDLEAGPEVRMRAPTFWAALHLAAARPDGSKPTVLISITQSVDAFALACADLIEEWQTIALPDYWSASDDELHWAKCLATAADYFTKESVEYRLLARGVVVHHGKMPGLLARRLKVLIDKGAVRVIIATSTLSEGVNIPVNFLLMPSVYRSATPFSLQEFNNLIGRAGRPGVAAEGSALVVLPERTYERRRGVRVPTYNRQWEAYEELVAELEATTSSMGDLVPDDQASSPLSHLLQAIREGWTNLTGRSSEPAFLRWLEQTAVPVDDDDGDPVFDHLDSLDGFLIAAIQEVEELKKVSLQGSDLEAELRRIWQSTYAHAAAHGEARLAALWLARGKAIKAQYPDDSLRRRLYKTSLTPRSGTLLLDKAEDIRETLASGHNYAGWETDGKLNFLQSVLAQLSEIPVFAIETKLGRKNNFRDWPLLLRWWLAKETLKTQPAPKEITTWFSFVASNFIYRGAWGLGSVIGVLMDLAPDGQPIRAIEIADWSKSGLPWIAFWIKELINWGTLDPVAAFILARGRAIDRAEAHAEAKAYYDQYSKTLNANELLDPRLIRDWLDARSPAPAKISDRRDLAIEVDLAAPAEDYLQDQIPVSPLRTESGLRWIDPAGHTVASSAMPDDWPAELGGYQFELFVPLNILTGQPYLPHA